MKLGIVGAGLIVHTFLEFAHELKIDFVALSATPAEKEKLEQMQKEHGFKYIYTDYQEMLNIPEVDTVYLGVNNHLHYSFGKMALEAGKHIIMEKPFTSNYAQAKEIVRIAEERNLLVFEAISTIYNPNFVKIKELLPTLGKIKIVTLNYTQYSSRYDAFRRGEILPAFDYRKSGGALMDLNIYNIHFIVGLFGKPKVVDYLANIEHDIDTSGILTLDYGDFKAVLIGAKDTGCPFINGVQGIDGCIYTSSPMFTLTHFDYQLNKQPVQHYDLTGNAHRMKHEFLSFLDIYDRKDFDENRKRLQHSLDVMEVLTEARNIAGIRFPDDETI
ncbi:MAG: Gfo/Idh/MocA family oxidoreductase [Erysipelotrichaceae bacterium]|nr:Gfo/Idh/MocA family oxidoreductase [Erysipelotrichaceae bacterium]